jgi:hypothetical protein
MSLTAHLLFGCQTTLPTDTPRIHRMGVKWADTGENEMTTPIAQGPVERRFSNYSEREHHV